MGLSREGRSVLMAIVVAVLSSTNGVAASLIPGVPAPVVGATALGMGGLALFGAFHKRAITALLKKEIWLLALIAGLSIVGYSAAFYSGLRLTGVAPATLLAAGSAPAFSALWEFVFERKRPSLRWCGGTGIAVGGLVIVTLSATTSSGGTGGWPLGTLLCTISGLCYATYAYCARRAIAIHSDPIGVVAGISGIGGVLLLPIVVIFGAPLLANIQTILTAVYLALGTVFAANILTALALRYIRASLATTISLASPALASVLAVLVLDQRLPPWAWVGVLVTLSGVALASTTSSRGRSRSREGTSASRERPIKQSER